MACMRVLISFCSCSCFGIRALWFCLVTPETKKKTRHWNMSYDFVTLCLKAGAKAENVVSWCAFYWARLRQGDHSVIRKLYNLFQKKVQMLCAKQGHRGMTSIKSGPADCDPSIFVTYFFVILSAILILFKNNQVRHGDKVEQSDLTQTSNFVSDTRPGAHACGLARSGDRRD